MIRQSLTTSILTAAILALASLTGPLVATAAAKKQVRVGVGPDVNLPVDEETGERPEPYVLFQLQGVKPYWLYRIVVEQSPKPTKKLPCNPGLTTSWERASAFHEVDFLPEPVTSGTYFPFAGQQPCKGAYAMEVQERRQGRRHWTAVRAFVFRYPSFSFDYVPIRRF
jgi:hypothetical protein